MYELITLTQVEDFLTITLNNPQKRNALSTQMMLELTAAFEEAGQSSVVGVVLAANGPAFSAGHDLSEIVGHDMLTVKQMLGICTHLMTTIQSIPQPVLASVQGLATAAGCQLVATCDLAVASEQARFATPGVKIGWYCFNPGVALSRQIGRKRAMEMLMTGEPIEAQTAAEWGLVNRVVPHTQLVEESHKLLTAATQGSLTMKGLGKQWFYNQIDLDQAKAYSYSSEIMAATSQLPDAQAAMQAFLAKRKTPPAQ